jgi:hypothetical protein
MGGFLGGILLITWEWSVLVQRVVGSCPEYIFQG